MTDQRTIAGLAALVDALPVAPSQSVIPCPEETAPAYDLQFATAKGVPPVAEVSIECFGVIVTVRGHDEPILSESASPGAQSFLETVASLLAPFLPHAG